jgi:hypothetical protein
MSVAHAKSLKGVRDIGTITYLWLATPMQAAAPHADQDERDED